MHQANIVTVDGNLAGVIDFGELCAGDPATDIALAWMLRPLAPCHDSLRPTPLVTHDDLAFTGLGGPIRP
jgi:aminoglycoside phosphotransferase (APT) family kinase protein